MFILANQSCYNDTSMECNLYLHLFYLCIFIYARFSVLTVLMYKGKMQAFSKFRGSKPWVFDQRRRCFTAVLPHQLS